MLMHGSADKVQKGMLIEVPVWPPKKVGGLYLKWAKLPSKIGRKIISKLVYSTNSPL